MHQVSARSLILGIFPFLLYYSEITEAEREEIYESEAWTEQERYWISIGWTASDSRPSAIAVGTVGGILLAVTPFMMLFAIDLPALYHDLRQAVCRVTKEKTRPKEPIKIRGRVNGRFR